MAYRNKIQYVEDDKESVGLLFRLRMPSLIIGLILGISISFLTSSFEKVISEHVQIAFFLPFIVYMADAIGTQTQTVYARDLKSGRAVFHIYLIKETFLGLVFGALFGGISALVALLWFDGPLLAWSVGLSMFISVATGPVIALLITKASDTLHEDPAAWAGPIATVIQDMTSILICGLVSSAILLG